MPSDSMSPSNNIMNMTCITPTPADEYSTPETPLAPRPSYTFRSIQQSDAVELCLPNHQLDLDAVRRPLARRNRAPVVSSSSMSHYDYGGVGQSSPVGVTDLSMPCLDDDSDDDHHHHHEDQHNYEDDEEPELMCTVPRVSLRMRPMTRDIAIGLFPELEAAATGGGEFEAQRRVYHHDASSSIPLSFRPLPLNSNSTNEEEDRLMKTSTPTPLPCFIPALVSTPHSLDGQSYEFYEQVGELSEVLIHTLPKELDLALPRMEDDDEDGDSTVVEEDHDEGDDDEEFDSASRSQQVMTSSGTAKQGAPLCRCSSVVQLTVTECTIRRTASAPALHHMTNRNRTRSSSSMSNKPDCFVFPLYRQMQRLFDGVCVAFS